MFKAKHSNLVFTQYEHLKLTGALALLWGNDEFELPPCDFESFALGVALHDRGYGEFDNLPIGEMSEEYWLHVSRKGFFDEYDNKVADLIVKHHVLRLATLGHHDGEEGQELIGQMRAAIQESVQHNNFDEELFAFTDRITDLCDSISFDFCFQNYGTNRVKVQKKFAEPDTTPVEYTIEPDNTIKIAPWPLSVSSYRGYILAYEATGFPEKREPKLIDYTIVPASTSTPNKKRPN